MDVNMLELGLIHEGRTYFIMEDGTVQTYYKTCLTVGQEPGIKPVVLVYDYLQPEACKELDTNQVAKIVNTDTLEFENSVKELFKFMQGDLATNPDLYSFLVRLWNHDDAKVEEMMQEDTNLEEEVKKYFSALKEREDLMGIAAKLFYEIYYAQTFEHVPYHEGWAKNRQRLAKKKNLKNGTTGPM